MPENTPPGVNIGAPISATDVDETGDATNDAIEFGNTLIYSLHASADTDDARAEAASFDIDASTGQLITKAPLDAEGTNTRYTVVVRVDDGETRTNPVESTVIVTVDDVVGSEPPLAPHPPTVVSGPDDTGTDNADESTTSLKVVWHEPYNMGRPGITRYDVAYKKSTETAFVTTNVDAHRHGYDRNDHGARGRHLLRRAGEGDQRRGRCNYYELVPRGDRIDQQGGQQPAGINRDHNTHHAEGG